MRRALLHKLPRLTRFTYGAITPFNVEDLTIAELSEYLTAMDRHEADVARMNAEQAARIRGR